MLPAELEFLIPQSYQKELCQVTGQEGEAHSPVDRKPAKFWDLVSRELCCLGEECFSVWPLPIIRMTSWSLCLPSLVDTEGGWGGSLY